MSQRKTHAQIHLFRECINRNSEKTDVTRMMLAPSAQRKTLAGVPRNH
jgi:hypothetical protein